VNLTGSPKNGKEAQFNDRGGGGNALAGPNFYTFCSQRGMSARGVRAQHPSPVRRDEESAFSFWGTVKTTLQKNGLGERGPFLTIQRRKELSHKTERRERIWRVIVDSRGERGVSGRAGRERMRSTDDLSCHCVSGPPRR